MAASTRTPRGRPRATASTTPGSPPIPPSKPADRPGLRRGPLPQVRGRPEEGPRGPRAHRRPVHVPLGLPLAGRPLAHRHHRARLGLARRLLHGHARAEAGVRPPRRREEGALLGRPLPGPVLRRHRRGRAPIADLRGRPEEAGARRLEGDRPRARRRHPRRRRRDRRAAGALLPQGRHQPPGDSRSRRQADQGGRAPRPRHRQPPQRAQRRGRSVLLLRIVHHPQRDPRASR